MKNAQTEMILGVRGHRGHWQHSHFYIAHLTSYLTLMHLSCTIKREASYLSKVADFNLAHLHLSPPLGLTPFEFG